MRNLARHQRAYKLVSGWNPSELRSAADLAQGYPIELRTSGTMQTLAFSLGKKDDKGHETLARAIANWVLSPESGAPLGSLADKDRTPRTLLDRLARAEIPEYIAADGEAIAFADSIKTIVKAVAAAGSR